MALDILLASGPSLRTALSELFAREANYALREVSTIEGALAEIDAATPDALLVSDDIGADDAAALLRAARLAGFGGPALSLCRGDRHGGLGFDAAIGRPFRFDELLLAIRKTLDQLPLPRALGEHSLCPVTQRLTAPNGATQPLTEKEIALLLRLSRAGGGVVARDVLLREIWGYSGAVVTHTLETHIHRLRRKLEGISGRTRLLVAAQGGYRLSFADDFMESVDTQPPEESGSVVNGAR